MMKKTVVKMVTLALAGMASVNGKDKHERLIEFQKFEEDLLKSGIHKHAGLPRITIAQEDRLYAVRE